MPRLPLLLALLLVAALPLSAAADGPPALRLDDPRYETPPESFWEEGAALRFAIMEVESEGETELESDGALPALVRVRVYFPAPAAAERLGTLELMQDGEYRGSAAPEEGWIDLHWPATLRGTWSLQPAVDVDRPVGSPLVTRIDSRNDPAVQGVAPSPASGSPGARGDLGARDVAPSPASGERGAQGDRGARGDRRAQGDWSARDRAPSTGQRGDGTSVSPQVLAEAEALRAAFGGGEEEPSSLSTDLSLWPEPGEGGDDAVFDEMLRSHRGVVGMGTGAPSGGAALGGGGMGTGAPSGGAAPSAEQSGSGSIGLRSLGPLDPSYAPRRLLKPAPTLDVVGGPTPPDAEALGTVVLQRLRRSGCFSASAAPHDLLVTLHVVAPPDHPHELRVMVHAGADGGADGGANAARDADVARANACVEEGLRGIPLPSPGYGWAAAIHALWE